MSEFVRYGSTTVLILVEFGPAPAQRSTYPDFDRFACSGDWFMFEEAANGSVLLVDKASPSGPTA